jgi:cytoskeletal protein RodZ
MATSSFVYFALIVFLVVVIMAGAVVISRFAGAIQQEQAETETKWEAADRMEAARLREDKNRMVGGK